MLRSVLLALSHRLWVRDTLVRLPVTRDVVSRFIAGETMEQALPVIARLVSDGLLVTVDHLGEDTVLPEQADATTAAYLTLLRTLETQGLAHAVEVSVKLSALGQFLPVDGERTALRNARTICSEAARINTTVTVDMEDHTTIDSTLGLVDELRRGHPWVGAVLQSSLRRTYDDCVRLGRPGSRIRLCKGAYDSPPSVAYDSRHDVDLSFVRCLRVLLDGGAKPLVATHDPRLIAIAEHLVHDRDPATYEFQMLYGIRPVEQRRLAGEGHRVRVYVPYGTDWYGYFVRRLAERPANLAFFLRSLAGRR